MQAGLVAVLHKPCVEVACYTPVAESVGAVGGDVNLYHPVALKVVIFGGGLAHRSVLGQHDDAVVARAYTYLVFGTYHAEALYAAQFRLLDDKLLVAVVEHAAQVSHDDFLSGSHVGGATHNLLRLTFAEVYGGDVQVVAVRVHLAGEHLAHIESLKAAFHGLYFFQCVNFESA